MISDCLSDILLQRCQLPGLLSENMKFSLFYIFNITISLLHIIVYFHYSGMITISSWKLIIKYGTSKNWLLHQYSQPYSVRSISSNSSRSVIIVCKKPRDRSKLIIYIYVSVKVIAVLALSLL